MTLLDGLSGIFLMILALEGFKPNPGYGNLKAQTIFFIWVLAIQSILLLVTLYIGAQVGGFFIPVMLVTIAKLISNYGKLRVIKSS